MSATRPCRVEIDHALLGLLGPDSTTESWRRLTRMAGLTSGLSRSDVPLISELVRRVEGIPAPRLVEPENEWFGLLQPFAMLSGFLGGGGLCALGGMVLRRPLDEGLLLLPWLLVAGVAFGIGVVFADRPRRPPGSNPVGPVGQAWSALQALRATTVVDVSDGVVVVNAPHRRWFAGLDADLAALEQQRTTQMEERLGTARRIEEVNRRLGQTLEDPEVERLHRSAAALEQRRVELAALRGRLDERRQAYEAQVEELLVRAGRRALSQQVDRLTLPTSAPPSQSTAIVEVDGLELEQEIRSLTSRVGEEDARLRAALEVAGLSR